LLTEYAGRSGSSKGKPCVPSGKGRVEVDGLLEIPLRETNVIWGVFAEMPLATLVGGPAVEVNPAVCA
jgi:hypothetical protein